MPKGSSVAAETAATRGASAAWNATLVIRGEELLLLTLSGASTPDGPTVLLELGTPRSTKVAFLGIAGGSRASLPAVAQALDKPEPVENINGEDDDEGEADV